MPWMRTGDNAATYPSLMALAADPASDERTVNEVFGWLTRCGIQSAAHLTDYIIDAGTAALFGGSRTAELVRLCVAAGVLTPTSTKQGFMAWQMIADPEFIHIRLRQEIEWERQQRADTRDPRLIVPVRLRDGDQCRWCGVLVQWRGKKSNRTGTLDHLEPGKAAKIDTLVVACMGCNSARGNNPEMWGDNHPLLDPPRAPRYGKWTAQLLTNNGHPTTPNVQSDDVSAIQAAPSAPTLARLSTPAAEVLSKATSEPDRSRGPGSGRDRATSGLGNHPPTGRGSTTSPPRPATQPQPQDTQTPPRRRRGRRGGRPRTNGGSA